MCARMSLLVRTCCIAQGNTHTHAHTHTHTHMHTMCNIINKDLLYSIGASIQYSVMAYVGKVSKKSGCIYN